jgi:hypothetical protein
MSRPRETIFAQNTGKPPWLGFLLAVFVLLFGGCTVGPNYRTPVVETPQAYK